MLSNGDWLSFDLPDGRMVTVIDIIQDPEIMLTHAQVEVLFRNQCIRCGRFSHVVHEMVPRSIAFKTWYHWSNQVVLCPVCHEWAHRVGTSVSRSILITMRDKRLEDLYGIQTNPPAIDT